MIDSIRSSPPMPAIPSERLRIPEPEIHIDVRDPVDVPVWWGPDHYRSVLPARVVGGFQHDTMQVAFGSESPRAIQLWSAEDRWGLLQAAERGETIAIYGLSRTFNSFRVWQAGDFIPMDTALLRAVHTAGLPAFASADDDFTQMPPSMFERFYRLKAGPLLHEAAADSGASEAFLEEFSQECAEMSQLLAQTFLAWLGSGSGVVVSTEPLAETARRVHPNVWLIPNGVDAGEYAQSVRVVQRSVQLGMTGGPLKYAEDLPLILPALLAAAREPGVALHFFGGHPDPSAGHSKERAGHFRLQGAEYVFHPLIEDTMLYQFAAGVLDVAALPLNPDLPFNRARSGQKYMEMALHETAMCLQRLGPHDLAAAEETCLKATEPEEWRENLGRLVRDGALRLRLGRAAKSDVLANHTMAQRAPLWRALVAEAGSFADTTMAA